MNISEQIGMPALLEQCAEECAELGKAGLKLARKLRRENPTPMTEKEIVSNLTEEIADVLLCIEEIVDSGLISNEAIDSVRIAKSKRWKARIYENELQKRGA